MVSMPAVLWGSVFVVGLATAGVDTPSISERVLLEQMVSVSAVWARQGDEGPQKISSLQHTLKNRGCYRDRRVGKSLVEDPLLIS